MSIGEFIEAFLQLDQGAQFTLVVGLIFGFWLLGKYKFELKRKKRRDYYRNTYLKPDAWKRKRYVVLKRDNWKCVYCGDRATQVHHRKYARNIGREPIKWLDSICENCHNKKH